MAVVPCPHRWRNSWEPARLALDERPKDASAALQLFETASLESTLGDARTATTPSHPAIKRSVAGRSRGMHIEDDERRLAGYMFGGAAVLLLNAGAILLLAVGTTGWSEKLGSILIFLALPFTCLTRVISNKKNVDGDLGCIGLALAMFAACVSSFWVTGEWTPWLKWGGLVLGDMLLLGLVVIWAESWWGFTPASKDPPN